MTGLRLTGSAAAALNACVTSWCAEQVQLNAHNLLETEPLALKENDNNYNNKNTKKYFAFRLSQSLKITDHNTECGMTFFFFFNKSCCLNFIHISLSCFGTGKMDPGVLAIMSLTSQTPALCQLTNQQPGAKRGRK